MSDGEVNAGRRRFLIGATSVVGGVGVIGAYRQVGAGTTNNN